MGWIVFWFIVIAGFLSYLADKNLENINKKNGFSHTKIFGYCGGNDKIIQDCKSYLCWSERENCLVITYKKVVDLLVEIIPYDDILKISAKTETQIRNDVTLTRLAILGIFALGAKKETKTSQYYLVIKYLNEDREEQNLILSGATQRDLNDYTKIIKDYRAAKEEAELAEIEAELLELEKEENNI